MTPERRRLVALVATATLGLVVLLGVRPLSTERILAGYVLALAAIALGGITRVLRGSSEWDEPSRFDAALRAKPPERVRPPELVRIERDIVLGMSNAGHMHARLLPVVREAAATRLRARHNVDLDRRPELSRSLLGDDAWELVRPDRAEPADLYAPGLPLKRIRELLDALERL
jgi:hypothetical protein